MHTDNKNIMLVDYCRADEIPACKLKLKAELFSTFCKLAKEGEKYIFTFWYSQVPLSKNSQSVQLAINAVIKDRRTDTEDIFRKIIPYTGRTLFSMFSSIFKLNKNHNEYIIGEKKMIIKCPRCGSVIPCAPSNETTLLKEEIKNKDLLIEQLRKDLDECRDFIATLPQVEETTTTEVAGEPTEATIGEIAQAEIAIETPVETVSEVATESAGMTATNEIVENPTVAEVETAQETVAVENETLTETIEEVPTQESVVENVETATEEAVIENTTTPIEENVELTTETVAEEPAIETPAVEETVYPIEEISPVVEEPVEAVEEKREIENETTETITEEPKEEIKAEEDPYHIHSTVVVKI